MPDGPSQPRSGRSPLEGTDRLVVDGTNLLYRITPATPAGPGGPAKAAPPAAIVGRLRAAIPAGVTIDLVFDGMGHGVFGRVAQGMTVRYAGRRTADDVILDLASEAAMERRGRATADGMLVVTNDREAAGPAAREGRADRAAPVADRAARPPGARLGGGRQPAAAGRERDRRGPGDPAGGPARGRGWRRRPPAVEAGTGRDDEDRAGAQGRSPQASSAPGRLTRDPPDGLLGCAACSRSSTS